MEMKTFLNVHIRELMEDQSQTIQSMLFVINQKLDANSSTILERLRNLVKHISLSPHSVEGQLISKDKFIIQAAPVIRRKLQKEGIGPHSTLENLSLLK